MEKYERRILIRVSDDDNVMWSCAPSRNLQFLHEKWVKEIHDETTMALIKNMELCWEIPLDSFINCIMPLNRVNLLDFLWFFCLFVNWNWLFWFVTDRCIDRWMVIFFNLRSLKKKKSLLVADCGGCGRCGCVEHNPWNDGKHGRPHLFFSSF